MRFLIPVALAAGGGKKVRFRGHGRLMERPLEPYFEIFREKGIRYELKGDLLEVEGALPAGRYSLSGKISSQFVTGLLLGLSLLPQPTEIVITDELQSKGYVDMTLSAMAAFGVKAENQGYRRFLLPGGQKFKATDCSVEGDYSQAAFFLGANFLGSRVEVQGMNPDSIQGDRAVLSILERMAQPEIWKWMPRNPGSDPGFSGLCRRKRRPNGSVCQCRTAADEGERPYRNNGGFGSAAGRRCPDRPGFSGSGRLQNPLGREADSFSDHRLPWRLPSPQPSAGSRYG